MPKSRVPIWVFGGGGGRIKGVCPTHQVPLGYFCWGGGVLHEIHGVLTTSSYTFNYTCMLIRHHLKPPISKKTKRTQAILNILLNDTPPFPKEMGTRMQPVCIQVGGGGGGPTEEITYRKCGRTRPPW